MFWCICKITITINFSLCHLKAPRALNRKDQDDWVCLQEGLDEFVLIAWCGRPDTLQLRNNYVSDIVAL